MFINIFSFLFGVFSTIVCAIYLFIRLLETLDTKTEKEYLEMLKETEAEKKLMKLDTSRYNSEKRGKVYIKLPDSTTNIPEKHYCVLKNNMLFLFNNPNDVSAVNVICFDGCSVSIVRNKIGSSKYNKKNCISVMQPERDLLYHSKILHFYFDCGKDLKTWYWFVKEASSMTVKKTQLEDQEEKICKKFFEELPARLNIPQSCRVGTIPEQTQPSVTNNVNNNNNNNSNNSNNITNSSSTSGGGSGGSFDTPSSASSSSSSSINSTASSLSSFAINKFKSKTSQPTEEQSILRDRSASKSSSTNSAFSNEMIDSQINTLIDDINDNSSSSSSSGGNSGFAKNGSIHLSSNQFMQNTNSSIPSQIQPVQSRYDWFNVALARVFFNFYASETLLGFAAEKITKKINKLKKPSILKSITLQNLDFGPNIPVLNDAKLLYLTPQGEFSADIAITYHGGFTLTIKIEVMISFRNHSVTIPFVISVLIKSLQGRLNVQCLPTPTKRLWIGFYEEPECELSIDTSIGQSKTGYFTNMPKLAKIIVNKLKAEVFEMMVLPNMDDFPLPHPKGHKNPPPIPQPTL
ncbi:PH domain-containing protein [Dictyostelium discoideum AX4]|uniref:PH domain-containing protein n=1 Tax=Dictyostelium discoideum TaxID=44689 RepID=Q556Y3_DICDI|nr:PH domain-containing protein [Dictyostelium discoideum AX4]XP_644764.1 PH domain-containing protein [Dictyostelium discoideum AX4]EAL70560.1 PH domain-containing protein [Dictyostelium discoideum AX4]EAL70814.1 PH domain-containing protein [Dictyostelium discoideum AX4]|eukprot:XP_644486.1 PH domain-containing protein [Dictyostelium discoideum AX4]